MTNDEIDAAVAELWNRRIGAFVDTPGGGRAGLDAKDEATTLEDIRMLNEARSSLSERSRAVLDLYVDVCRSFGRQRCSVRCLTTNQSAEIGYDCAMEC